MAYCAPNKGKNGNYCLDDNLIDELVLHYNKFNNTKIDINKNYSEKLNLLINNLKNETGCDKEYCLTKSKSLSNFKKILDSYYRPELPKEWKIKKREWLNTLDILASMSQYSESIKGFRFLSVSPIDFDTLIGNTILSLKCVDNNLCKLDINKEANNGFNKIGAIFNLDKHYQSGSHWVAFFADFLIGEIYYFDSVAMDPPPEVVNLITRINTQGDILAKKINIIIKNRFTFSTNNIPIDKLIEWLTIDNNLLLYRYGLIKTNNSVYIEPNNIKIPILDKSIKNKLLDKLGTILNLPNTRKYLSNSNLSNILENYESTKNLETFIYEWLISNLNITISNYLHSLTTIKSNNNQIYKINKINIIDNNIILDINNNSDFKNVSFVDVSFKGFKNFIQHQYKNTECGMYSIYFIDNILTSNRSFYEIISDIKDDDTMNNMRFTKYYRPN